MARPRVPAVVLTLAAALASALGAQEPSDEGPVARAVLDNGLRVVALRVDGAEHVCVGLGVRVGGDDDPEGRCGLSHLLEHMVLHGPGPRFAEPFATLTRDGPSKTPYLDVNAETMRDATYYYALRPADRLGETLALFAERLAGSGFAPDAAVLEQERPRVLAEIHHVEQNLSRNPRLARSSTLFARRPKPGRQEDVDALTLDDLQRWHRAHYRPGRAVVVVCGGLPAAEMLQAVRRSFGAVDRAPSTGADPAEAPGPRAPEDPGQRAAVLVADPDDFGDPVAMETEGEDNENPSDSAAGPATVAPDARLHARAALDVVASACALRLGRGAYVEHLAEGRIRLALVGDSPHDERRERLVDALGELAVPDPDGRAFRSGRQAAGRFLRQRRITSAPAWIRVARARDPHRGLIQGTIDRLVFELAGGDEYLEALERPSETELAALAARWAASAREDSGSRRPGR